jgi:PTH1 family peptidyl-tRNA hydrolase
MLHPSRPDLLIIGLGNPGPKYDETRHNAGFWLIDLMAKKQDVSFSRVDRSTHLSEVISVDGKSILLSKPRTYMNNSGESVKYLVSRYGIDYSQLLILYDDIHLPAGKLRLRAQGSAGGHNGMRSIISALNSNDFPRMRIGVGGPSTGKDQIGYVLGRPDKAEMKKIDDALEEAIQVVTHMLVNGIDAAMSEFN